MKRGSPRFGLRNGHIQSLLSAVALRKPLVGIYAKKVIERAEEMVFECSDSVRVHGLLSKHDHRPRPLVASHCVTAKRQGRRFRMKT